MKTMQFTNDEIAILFDAIDAMYDQCDDVIDDEINQSLQSYREIHAISIMQPDDASHHLALVDVERKMKRFIAQQMMIATLRQRLIVAR